MKSLLGLDSAMALRLKAIGPSGKEAAKAEKRWLSAQYKVLDVGRPLINLWSRLAYNDQALPYLECAIRLWGEAFNEILMRRRKTVLQFTDPSLEFLVSESAAKMTSNLQKLFGPDFTKIMVEETGSRNTLGKLKQPE